MAHSQDTMTVLPIKLRSSEKERLKRIGLVKKRSPHWLIKEAIHQYLEQEELVEKFKQETIDRWEKYCQDNESVSDDKVMARLDSWGKDHEKRLHYENQVAS